MENKSNTGSWGHRDYPEIQCRIPVVIDKAARLRLGVEQIKIGFVALTRNIL